MRAGGIKSLTDAAALLEQVVVHDPNYAPAWAQLARDYATTPSYHPAWLNGSIEELRRVVDATLPKAERAARRAIQLDSDLPDAYVPLANVEHFRRHVVQADELLSKALALDPNNSDVLHSYSLMLAAAGHVREALAMRQQLQLLDPFPPLFNGNTAVIRWVDGQTDTAIATLSELPQGDAFRGYFLPRMYAAVGRYAESSDALRKAPFAYVPGMRETALRLLGTAPTLVASPESLPHLGNMEFVYLHIGATNRVLDFYEDILSAGYPLSVATSFLWHASYAPVRRTERFKAYVRKLGLVDFWRAKGWPNLCHPTTGDDFVCS